MPDSMSPSTPSLTPDSMMQIPGRFAPPDSFVDPRTQEGFQPACWPLCNDEDAPPSGATDLHERRCVEFLAAYYEVNCRNAALLAARDSAQSDAVNACLAAVESALLALDELEDRYTPIGFYGEPKMDGVFYRSIGFHRPELPRLFPQPSNLSSHIAVPTFADIPAEELQGPITITRWP